MPHKVVESVLLTLPPELLALIFSFCGCEEIRCFLEALPSNSPVFRLFELFVADGESPFFYKRQELSPSTSVRNALKDRQRSLITLFEIDQGKCNSQESIAPFHDLCNADGRLFFGVLKNSGSKASAGNSQDATPLDQTHFPGARVMSLNGGSVACHMDSVVSDVHFKNYRYIRLLQGHSEPWHSRLLRLENIRRLEMFGTPSKHQLPGLAKEPRETLILHSLTPFALTDATIIASKEVKLTNCEHLERVSLPNATKLILVYPEYPSKKWRPIIRKIKAPKLRNLVLEVRGERAGGGPLPIKVESIAAPNAVISFHNREEGVHYILGANGTMIPAFGGSVSRFIVPS